jgi:hypothetical protein
VHQRVIEQTTPDEATERLRIVTVFLVNRRKRARAPYSDLAYAFQARIELVGASGFRAAIIRPTPRATPTCGSPTCIIATTAILRWDATFRVAGTSNSMRTAIGFR